jgi:arylsulfatase A-like enzyme
MSDPDRHDHPSRRDLLAAGAAMLGAGLLPPLLPEARAQAAETKAAEAPKTPPSGYNILFILVDQEHFFDGWPFPVPGREWIKRNGITFANHQAASCVCSPARSVIYTGRHIQGSGVFDNLNYLWQPDLSTEIATIGHRMSALGYYAAYEGKWHMSANLDQTRNPLDAPLADYQKIIASYGFDDFFGVGDLIDGALGGYTYDYMTSSSVSAWLRTKGQALKEQGKPWYLAVNFVNPHDVMYINSDKPGENVQTGHSAITIEPRPEDELYGAAWDVPLPATRSQPLDAPGRPPAHRIYQEVQDMLVGPWPDEDRRWKLLRDYYFNCIRDCDGEVERVLAALRNAGMDKNTIVVFTADHGELGGNHQMRGKGTCTYRQQNHVPLMIHHPAYPGGKVCRAVTSQLDLAPTLMALTGASPALLAKAGAGLKGRSFAGLLADPGAAGVDGLRPAALFNYNMLSYQDAKWNKVVIDFMMSPEVPTQAKIDRLLKDEPDFHHRCAIRSVFDGRYRFSRYFAPLDFNTPKSFEDLSAHNDLELYDLETDPEETDNLAMKGKAAADLVMAMNEKLNARIAEEVGDDDGSFLPIRNGKWYFPDPRQR